MKKRMVNDDEYYCGIHKDKKGLDFVISDKEGTQDSIFIRTKELEDGIYKTYLDVREYDEKAHKEDFYHKDGEVYLNLYSENKLNIEALFERLTEEYEQGSEIPFQKVLEEFPTFINPYKVEGTIKNTNSFIEIKECDNLELKLIDEKSYEGNVKENYIKNENEISHSYSFYNNEWEEKSKETHLSNGKQIYEYEDYTNPEFEINKMKIEVEGNKIKFNDLTPEEMVKEGKFGTNFKHNINSSEELDRVSKRFYEKIYEKMNNNAGNIVKCSSDIQEKIVGNFKKGFNKIKKQMLKQENKKNTKKTILE